MRAMSKLMALAIHNKKYTKERVPLRLREQVEEFLAELEGESE